MVFIAAKALISVGSSTRRLQRALRGLPASREELSNSTLGENLLKLRTSMAAIYDSSQLCLTDA